MYAHTGWWYQPKTDRLHRTSKHDAMFADVRQHFILSSALSVEKTQKISYSFSLSLFDWLPRIRTYVYLSERVFVKTHVCVEIHAHRVEELSVPIPDKETKKK